MHHIYHTEGIILGSRNYGESGKYYSVFTKDLGMMHAQGRGVRTMTSKLRFVLQDFAYVKIDLVEGKNVWRITSASKTGLLEEISKNLKTREVFYNIARLLKRLLAGVEPNPDLFRDVVCGLSILEGIKGEENIRNVETIIVLRVLHNLGYIGGAEALGGLVHSPFEEGLVHEISKHKRRVILQINKALKETHL